MAKKKSTTRSRPQTAEDEKAMSGKQSGDREEDTGESTVVGSADQAREDGGAQVEDQE
jgi:hypothetical protein